MSETTSGHRGTDGGGDDESDTAGFESLLDVVTSLVDLPWNLDWHYRSRDDEVVMDVARHRVRGGCRDGPQIPGMPFRTPPTMVSSSGRHDSRPRRYRPPHERPAGECERGRRNVAAND